MQNHEDLSKLASGAGISLIGRVAGRVFFVISEIILARFLGPAAFGLYAIGWTLLRLVGLAAPLGLHNGVIRFGAQLWPDSHGKLRDLLQKAFRTASLSSLTVGAIMFACAGWIEVAFQKPGLAPVIRWFALGIPLITLLRLAAAATRVSLRMKYSVIAEDFVQPLLDLVFIIVVYFLSAGITGALIAGIASLALAMLLAFYYLRQVFAKAFQAVPEFSLSGKALLAFSLPTALTGFFATAIIWVDRLIVGYFRLPAEVGIYQAASQSSTFFAIILTAMNVIFTPMISDLYHKGEHKRLEDLYRVSTKWALYISLPVLLVILFIPELLMKVVFGQAYAAGALPLLILNLGQLVNVATGAVGFLLIMTGHQNRWLVYSALALVGNIVMNLVLIPRYGVVGAAISTSTAVAALFLVGLLDVRLSLKLWPYDRRYLKGLAAALLSGLGILALRSFEIQSDLLALIMISAAAVLVFVLVLLALRLDEEDLTLLRQAAVRLKTLSRGNSNP